MRNGDGNTTHAWRPVERCRRADFALRALLVLCVVAWEIPAWGQADDAGLQENENAPESGDTGQILVVTEASSSEAGEEDETEVDQTGQAEAVDEEYGSPFSRSDASSEEPAPQAVTTSGPALEPAIPVADSALEVAEVEANDAHLRRSAAVDAALAAADRAWHLGLVGGFTPVFVRHPSFDPLSSSDLLLLGEVALEAEWRFSRHLTTMLRVGYAGATKDEDLFSSFFAETRVHSVQVGLLLGSRVLDWLMPFVQGALTVTWTEVRLSDNRLTLGGWGEAVGGSVMGGVELSVPRRWIAHAFHTAQFTFGMRIEGGYLFLGGFDFDTQLRGDSLSDEVALSMGSLRLQGAGMRVSFVSSF